MRLLPLALLSLAPSLALAQEGPGGPKLYDELEALTSTTSTTTYDQEAEEEEEPQKQPLGNRRGILGINVVNLGGFVRVKSLKPKGPAERAGIKKWDTIVSIDGKPIRDRREYVFLMAGRLAGQTVTLEWRGEDASLKKATIVLDAGRRIIGEGSGKAESGKKKKVRVVRRKKKPKTRKWYGWQGLVSDVPSLVISVIGLATENEVVAGIGLAGYGIGTPMAHFFHDNVGTGLISMALRGVIPGLTVLGTIAICDEARICSDASPLVVIGAITMFVAIPAVDAAALSWQKLEPPKVDTSVKVSIAPAIAPTDRGGAMFGLAGRF